MNANESYKTCYYILVITVICLILINIFDAHQLYSYWDEVLNTLKLAKSNKYNKIYTICIKPQYIFRAVELTNILYTSFIVLILITISNSQRGESTNIILFSCVKSIVFWYGPLQLILCLLAFLVFPIISPCYTKPCLVTLFHFLSSFLCINDLHHNFLINS